MLVIALALVLNCEPDQRPAVDVEPPMSNRRSTYRGVDVSNARNRCLDVNQGKPRLHRTLVKMVNREIGGSGVQWEEKGMRGGRSRASSGSSSCKWS